MAIEDGTHSHCCLRREQPSAPARSRCRIERPSMPRRCSIFRRSCAWTRTSPPGNEKPAADYVAQVLEREGIPVQVFALEAHRPNVVARLTGNGSKRPLLLMAHTDTVNVDPAKWQHPPFSAARDGEHIYGRGTVDDKDSVTAALMTMLTAEAQSRGARSRRDLPRRSRRGGQHGRRHRAHGQRALRRDRCRVLPRRGRQRDACRWRDALCRRADGGEIPEGHRPHRARRRGARLRAAREQSDRAARARDHAVTRMAAARRAQRHDARVLRAARRDREGSRARAPLSRSLELRSGGRRRGRRMAARQYPVPSLDAADVDLAEHRARRLPQQRDSFRGARDARRAHAPRRGPRSIPRRARAPHRRRPRSTSCSTATASGRGRHVTGRRRGVRRHRARDRRALRGARAAR